MRYLLFAIAMAVLVLVGSCTSSSVSNTQQQTAVHRGVSGTPVMPGTGDNDDLMWCNVTEEWNRVCSFYHFAQFSGSSSDTTTFSQAYSGSDYATDIAGISNIVTMLATRSLQNQGYNVYGTPVVPGDGSGSDIMGTWILRWGPWNWNHTSP